MLGLKCDTSKTWVEIVENNLQQLLTNHAFAEQKAAASAMSLIIGYSEDSYLVNKMHAIALEELEHFGMVHQILKSKGWVLGQDQKNDYVKNLFNFYAKTKDRTESLVNRLLVSAIIEARSCERFKVLSEYLSDKALAQFYKDLLVSEAGHHTLFLDLARKYQIRILVDEKWDKLTSYEADYMKNKGTLPLIHG